MLKLKSFSGAEFQVRFVPHSIAPSDSSNEIVAKLVA